MKYIKVNWIHDPNEDPVFLYSELGKDMFEVRKIEIFSDGSFGYADKKNFSKNTRLGDKATPPFEEINAHPEFTLVEISAEEFEGMWAKAYGGSAEQKCSNPVTPEDAKKLLDLALHVAEIYNVALDYSQESIQEVEKILSDIHDEYAKTGNEKGLNGVAVEFGAYIVEVIIRNTHQGKWYTNHSQLGEKTFPFYWKGSVIFPYAWCQKRIFDGNGDDVWAKYKALVLPKIDN